MWCILSQLHPYLCNYRVCEEVEEGTVLIWMAMPDAASGNSLVSRLIVYNFLDITVVHIVGIRYRTQEWHLVLFMLLLGPGKNVKRGAYDTVIYLCG